MQVLFSMLKCFLSSIHTLMNTELVGLYLVSGYSACRLEEPICMPVLLNHRPALLPEPHTSFFSSLIQNRKTPSVSYPTSAACMCQHSTNLNLKMDAVFLCFMTFLTISSHRHGDVHSFFSDHNFCRVSCTMKEKWGKHNAVFYSLICC